VTVIAVSVSGGEATAPDQRYHEEMASDETLPGPTFGSRLIDTEP
jgi:hypothetical protein